MLSQAPRGCGLWAGGPSNEGDKLARVLFSLAANKSGDGYSGTLRPLLGISDLSVCVCRPALSTSKVGSVAVMVPPCDSRFCFSKLCPEAVERRKQNDGPEAGRWLRQHHHQHPFQLPGEQPRELNHANEPCYCPLPRLIYEAIVCRMEAIQRLGGACPHWSRCLVDRFRRRGAMSCNLLCSPS